MKRLILFTFAVLSIAACTSNTSSVFSVAIGEDALSDHGIKSVVITYYNFKDGEWEIDQNGIRDTILYMPNGLLAEEGNAHSRRRYVYKYDSLNRIDTVFTYLYAGRPLNNPFDGYQVYKYDDLNRISRIFEYDEDDAEKTVSLYRYSNSKRTVENFEKMYTNGTRQYTTTDVCKGNHIVKSTYKSQYSDNTTQYEYNASGELIKDVTTYKDDDGKSISTFNYENGLVLNSDYSDGDGRLYEYEFNDKGAWTKREVFSKKGHTPISKTIREIEYY